MECEIWSEFKCGTNEEGERELVTIQNENRSELLLQRDGEQRGCRESPVAELPEWIFNVVHRLRVNLMTVRKEGGVAWPKEVGVGMGEKGMLVDIIDLETRLEASSPTLNWNARYGNI